MNRQEKRAYSRGYAAASRGDWPVYRTVLPNQPHIAAMLSAAMQLRDAVDAELATFWGDEPQHTKLARKVDAFDKATNEFYEWVRTPQV